ATALTTSRTNVQLGFTQTPCSGLLPSPGNALTTGDEFCESGAPVLHIQNNYGNYSGMSYQWQWSADGQGGWQDLAGANQLFYQAPELTGDIWYRAGLSCDGGNEVYSTAQLIQIHTLPEVVVDETEVVYCD